MEYVKDICEIGEKAGELLKKINRGEELKVSDAPAVKELMSIVQKSMDIDRMDKEDGGYSQDGEWTAEGNYGRGVSYGGRRRDSMGRYSREDGYSSRRDSRGRYSRAGGREEMMEHVRMAMESAPEEYKEDIHRLMREIEKG